MTDNKNPHFILYLMSPVVEWNVERIILTVLYKTKMLDSKGQICTDGETNAKIKALHQNQLYIRI